MLAKNEQPFWRQWWVWVAILPPTLIMLPVFIWPHYGLFSDAGQAISFPKLFIDEFPKSMELLRPKEDGRWNPLFHGLTILIYAVAPASARALYVAQWIMFVVSALSIAWILLRLTGRVWLVLLGIALFCTASSVYENFYTLDKVEPRLTFFSAVIVVSLIARFLSVVKADNKLVWWHFVLIQTFCGIWLVFSKETGVYMVAALGGAWLACLFNPQWGREVRNLFRNAALIQVVIAVVFVVLFKMLSLNMSYRYVSYQVTPFMVYQNIGYYLLSSPELALGLLCALYWCLSAFLKRIPRPVSGIQPVLVFLSICELSYFAGISLWRWPLDYYLLPAHFVAAILLPVTIWAIPWPPSIVRLRVIAAWLAAITWCGFLVFRLFLGSVIYVQDALKDDLALYLSSPEWFEKRLVLPLVHPDSAEVGERLEFFINRNRHDEHVVDLFNFWEPAFLNRKNLDRFDSGAGIAPDPQQLIEITQHPERYVVWQLGHSGDDSYLQQAKDSAEYDDTRVWRAEMPWRSSYLRRGDLILVPTGSKLLQSRFIRTRGIGMHVQTIQQFVRKTPVELAHIGGVQRKLPFVTMGWDIFRVENTAAEVDIGQGYSLSSLLALNTEVDIIPPVSSETLFDQHRYPENGVLLGGGWYGIEQSNGVRFRWMGASSDVILTWLPIGDCTLTLDVEPMLTPDSEPFSLKLGTGSDQAVVPLQGRNTVTFSFRSSGEKMQVVRLDTIGGAMDAPKGDPRLLKVRAFFLRLLQCETGTQ